MTALEPGQHDPLAGLHRYEVRPFALRDMPWDDVMDRDDDYGPFVKYADLPALIARVVERERGKALAEAAQAVLDMHVAANDFQCCSGRDDRHNVLVVAESAIRSLAAARPAEGTPGDA